MRTILLALLLPLFMLVANGTPAQGTSYAAAVQAVQPAMVALQAMAQSGSGMVVSAGGLVLTNLHVVANAENLTATLPDGRTVAARVVAQAPALDAALVQLSDVSNLTTVTFAGSSALQAGDVVLSVGYPFGGAQSVSVGVVGTPKRLGVMRNPFQPFIQTDAALAPGSSGGALIMPNGRVVGMVAAVQGQGGGRVPGFALPSDTLMALLNDWRQYGKLQVGWFGAEGRALNTAELAALEWPEAQGMVLTTVLPRSPAAQAGLKTGDILRRINGLAITNASRVPQDVGELRHALDAPISLEIWRDGGRQTLPLKLGAPPPRRSAEQALMRGYNPLNSVQLEPITPALAQELGLPLATQGVVITRLSTQPLSTFDNRFAVGDVIFRINGQPTFTPTQAQGALNTSRRAWEIEFFRAGTLRKIQF